MPNEKKHSTFMIVIGISVMSVALASGMTTVSAQESQSNSEPGAFTVKDGKVDPSTYQGYMTYTRHCQACHGPDGLGSSFAPSLVQAAERRTFSEIARTIAGGLQIQPGRVMPSFADTPSVISNIGNIYSYLKARASGELDRGRPEIIEGMQKNSDG